MRVLLATIVFLLAATPAQAQWSPPANVSSGHQFVDNPTLAFSSAGLATWTAQDGVGNAATSATYDAPLGQAERVVSRTATISPPVLYGATRTAAARLAGSRLSIVFGRTDGSFGAPELIADRTNIRSVVLAGDAQGDLALAWFEDRGVTTDRVYVAFRPHGKPFTPPLLQATDRVRSVSVAVSPKGALLLAYDARGTVKVRYKPATAPLFRHLQTIASEPTFFARLRTAVTNNGRAYIGWAAQFLSEGGDAGDGFYEVAVQPAGALEFRPAQLLEQRPATELAGGLDLVTDDANGATVAWGETTVKAATTNAAGTFGAPMTIAPGLEAAIAGAPDGRALVAFIQGREGAGALLAATSHNGVFGPPETVTPGPQARVPAAAYDAGSNRWALVWSNRPSGSPPSFLQASSEPGGPPG
jgi:hypothetical protein